MLTLDGIVEGALDPHGGHNDKLEFALTIFVVKEVLNPFAFCFCSNCTADLVVQFEELIDDVATDETICASDQDGRAFCNWCHSESWL
jgi:hypothetical protein